MSKLMLPAMLAMTGMDEEAIAWRMGVRPRRVKKWLDEGVQPVEVTRLLGVMMDEQQAVADEICDQWDAAGRPLRFAYAVSPDDAAAREIGWPSRAAQLRALAIAQMILREVVIEAVETPVAEAAPDADAEVGQAA